MTEVVDYLKTISGGVTPFAPAQYVKQLIDAEIRRVRYYSRHGPYHDYVTRHGYPIPKDLLESQEYHDRDTLQKALEGYILDGENIIILGCEGSGKTTTTHRVVGEMAHDKSRRFIYMDVSDIEVEMQHDYLGVIYTKILTSITSTIGRTGINSFEQWIEENRTSGFLASVLLDNRSTKQAVEIFFAYIRTRTGAPPTFIILDNIDSLSANAARTLFNALNLIDNKVVAICNQLGLQDHGNIRYIICCRTPTYVHVSGLSKGLSIGFPHAVLRVDDDFLNNTSVVGLLRSSLLALNAQHSKRSITISLFQGVDETLTWEDYIQNVIRWLAARDAVFSRTIKQFCGRSIRRAKLYGLKVLGGELIARLAMLEERNVIQVTRTDRKYLDRRLKEAIFDFASASESLDSKLSSFPMNPFRVVEDESEFLSNPLIGVMGIDYIKTNATQLAREDIFFARTVAATEIVKLFERVGYSDEAIKDFFCACRDCGLLRPVSSSPVLMGDPVAHRDIHELYVLDDRARDSYYNLVFCHNARDSMIFYNGAVRAHYGISMLHQVDNMLYEVYTTLIFLGDIMKREEQLRRKMRDSGVLFEPLSSRVRSTLIPHLASVINTHVAPGKNGGLSDEELVQRTEQLFSQIKKKIGESPSII